MVPDFKGHGDLPKVMTQPGPVSREMILRAALGGTECWWAGRQEFPCLLPGAEGQEADGQLASRVALFCPLPPGLPDYPFLYTPRTPARSPKALFPSLPLPPSHWVAQHRGSSVMSECGMHTWGHCLDWRDSSKQQQQVPQVVCVHV